MFIFECHILSDYFIISYLSANKDGPYGTLQDTMTEMDDDIKLLILLSIQCWMYEVLPNQLLFSTP